MFEANHGAYSIRSWPKVPSGGRVGIATAPIFYRISQAAGDFIRNLD
ncbi:MAG: hypothetical protein AVDCRST_MAG22-712 [uncultured Rubrobacteraceae bacterium]|uniref:Uncharacterized protein n=1 Tax=uncultured Rubrobacteraceae bacterium TaxID=349277 RepID=A0A6J4NQ96_9ACTN|nr:MAG: hypothetical protein AVDCRST_MAG22-712 [uncultured Rubrobacteraceae bacterium]